MAETATVSAVADSTKRETMTHNQSLSSGSDAPSLHFSGLSDELEPTNGANGAIMSHTYSTDLEDHVVAPVSSIKAIRTVDNHDHMLSDDECPKVLTTLETVKKPTPIVQQPPPPPVVHEEEEGTILLEVIDNNKSISNVKSLDSKKQLAEIQLKAVNAVSIRGRPRKYSTIDGGDYGAPKARKLPNTYRHSIDTAAIAKKEVARKPTKPGPISSTILTKAEIQKVMTKKFAEPVSVTKLNSNKKPARILNKIDQYFPKTPIKPIPVSAPSSGTIEIPRELLLSDTEIPASPVILNHVNTGCKMDNDELIAILEGDGDIQPSSNVEHFEVSLTDDGSLHTVAVNAQNLSKDEEREIAMHQMLNLPIKKKGRPKLDPAQKKTPPAKVPRAKKSGTSAANELLSALVSDWDENDVEMKADQETEIIIEITNDAPAAKVSIAEPRKRKITPPSDVALPTFKRQRVIKKKIIWDPDAPETAINYASYAHTSGPGPQKKPLNRKNSVNEKVEKIEKPIKVEKADKTEKLIKVEKVEKVEKAVHPKREKEESPTPAALKKKKTSEIDKLLGDEGAKNMLDSLNQDNNNSVSLSKPSRKIIRPEPYDSIIHSLPRIKAPRKEPVAAKPVPAVAVKKESPTVPKKRGPKPATSSSSWDYVYSAQANDDCMIIRRRSNSSYSSTASANRSSMDLATAPPIVDNDIPDIPQLTESAEPVKKKSRASKEKDKVFEFVKPVAKKPIKIEANPVVNQSILSDIRGKFNKAISGEAKKPVPNVKPKKEGKLTETVDADNVALDDVLVSYSELTLKWHKHCVQLILSPLAAGNGGRYKNLFTIQVNFVLTEMEIKN